MTDLILSLNGWAVLVATVVYFLLGALWYSPLVFAKQWMTFREITEEEIGQPNPMLFAFTFLLQLIAVTVLALLVAAAGAVTALQGAFAGFGAGVIVFALTANTALFAGTRPGLHIIDNGYHVLGLTLAGLILGAW